MNAGTIKKTLTGLTVVAASLVTVAGPASAAKNNGGYQQSSEAHKQQQVDVCGTLYSGFANLVDLADAAYQSGHINDMKADLAAAQKNLTAAQNYGCDWAQRVAPPQPPGPVPTVGANPGSVSTLAS